MLVCKEQYDPKIPRAIFLTKKKDPSSAALAAPHERAGFARAETLQSLPTSSSGPGARLRRLTGSVSPVRVDSGGHTFDSSELTRTPHGPPLPNPGRAPERDSRDSRAKDLAPEFTRAPRAVACFATRLSRSRHRGAQDSRRPRHPTDEQCCAQPFGRRYLRGYARLLRLDVPFCTLHLCHFGRMDGESISGHNTGSGSSSFAEALRVPVVAAKRRVQLVKKPRQKLLRCKSPSELFLNLPD